MPASNPDLRIAFLRRLTLPALLVSLSCAAPPVVEPVGPAPVAIEAPAAADVEGGVAAAEGAQEGDAMGRSEQEASPSTIDASIFATPGEWSRTTLASLSLRQKIGQMIMPFVLGDYAPEGTPAHDRIVRHIEEDEVGGVIVSVGTPTDVAVKLNDLQRHSRLPLLVAADLETGAGFRMSGAVHLPTNIVLGGATNFPPAMAIGATRDAGLAYEMGRVTAVEARALGVHIPFAPVLDVNNNPDNPIINTRSFAEDPVLVSQLGRAFVRGVQEYGALATGKHFPGHGDTDTDSHLALPVIRADRARMDTLELRPFREVIASGLGGIMTAHIAIPALNDGTELPATLSAPILTGMLRGEFGFGGLVFTDAMDMQAIDDTYPRGEAAVRAVEAGADVVLMPPSIPQAIEALLQAVQSGRITEDRIDQSVLRILRLKEALALHREREVELDRVPRVVGIPEHRRVADEVARRSITLLRNEGDLLPLEGTRTARVMSVSLRRTNDLLAARTFNAALRETYPRLTSAEVTRDSPASVYDGLLRQAESSNLVVISLYVSWNSYAGQVALPEEMVAFVDGLTQRGIPHVVISFGNPYLLREIPSARSYLLAWSGTDAAQRAAAGALFGRFALEGRTPTRLPPFFEIGDGILLPARAAAGAGDEATAAANGGDPVGVNGNGGANGGDPVGANGNGRANGFGVGVRGAVVVPDVVGMDAAELERLDAELATAIADGAAPGASLAIGRNGRLVRLDGVGVLDRSLARPVTPATIYDLASVTKVVATTTAVMVLVDDGRLSLDDPVVSHLPGWDRGDARKADVTVRDLLLHRAGFVPFRQWFFEFDGRERYREALYDEPLERAPGEATVYSDLGVLSLGLVVEAVAGEALDAFVERRVFGPLGMRDTVFRPGPQLLGRVAPTEVDTIWRGMQAHGVVHDENAEAFGGVAGHAGLFSTASDLAVFADLLLREGVVPPCTPDDGSGVPCPVARADSVRIVRPETVRLFTRRHDDRSSRALGWDTPSGQSSAGDLFSARSFGHTGYTGTSIWMDPERDLFVVLLTNRVNPTRENQRHVPLRRSVHDHAARAVRDVAAMPRTTAGR